jgi:nucleoside-triphosphatase
MKTLITGLPQCGKTTLILKIIEYLTTSKSRLKGFLTPEVRDRNSRIGFDILDIQTGERQMFARTGNFNTKYQLGKYKIFIDDFEKLISKYDDSKLLMVNLLIIDEIGKMELLSKKFKIFIKNIFNSEISIIATIGSKLRHPIKDYLMNIPSIKILTLTRQNFQKIFKKIVSLLA